ncbi:MAG: ParB/RepB/Spo0J family partition protein [Verrucomicrobiae bacterium]|nr:ParB/RepB/Spo0J family partition protein [Verrucomicrobiae bacterium]
MSKPALGRGLSALLGGRTPGGASTESAPAASGPPAAPNAAPNSAPDATPSVAPPPIGPSGTSAPSAVSRVPGEGGVERVPVGRIRPSALQPRRDFPEQSLQELTDSIREQGILQPLVVRQQGEFLELIAGERRWRAAQRAGMAEVPVIVREADDTTALEWMLVENLQREGLNPMEEAQGYGELMERFDLTQEAVATRVGRSRASVANALRLLKLPGDVQGWLRAGRLTAGHAKAILALPPGEPQTRAARRVLDDGLSVRQVEELVALWTAKPESAPSGPAAAPASSGAGGGRDPHVAAMEDQLRQRLGTRVNLRYRQGRGQIDIRFANDADLERVLEVMGIRMEESDPPGNGAV